MTKLSKSKAIHKNGRIRYRSPGGSRLLTALVGLLALGPLGLDSAKAEDPTDKEIVVYSARTRALVQPVFDQFTKETGIKVKFTTDKAGALAQKLIAEGDKTPADILLTVDAGNLWYAAQKGLLTPYESTEIKKAVPGHLRDPKGNWSGFSVRARTIVYNPSKVNAADLKSYADLGDKKWKGKLCLRTSKKVYNQSLVATLIAEHGEAKTENIVKGWVDNLAVPVFSNDTRLLKAIANGPCSVGIANTYYLGRLLKENPSFGVKIFWPKAQDGGAHVNVSGAGLVKHGKNPKLAKQFLDWLAKPAAQDIFARVNLEFPVLKSVDLHPIVKSWGPYVANSTNLAKAGELQAASVKLMDRSGYK